MAATHVTPISSSTTHLQGYRHRAEAERRPALPDGNAARQRDVLSREEERRQHPGKQDDPPAPRPARSGSASFAAAVIAGALPPVPKTMNELMRRIGASEIPPESAARLRDILV